MSVLLSRGKLGTAFVGGQSHRLILPGASQVHWFNGADVVDSGGNFASWDSRAQSGAPGVATEAGSLTVSGADSLRHVAIPTGTSDYLTANAVGALVAGEDTDFIVALAFEIDDITGNEVLLAFSTLGVSGDEYITVGHQSGRIWVRIRESASSTNYHTESPQIVAGTRHVVTVHRPGTEFRCWLDGVPFFANTRMTADVGNIAVDQLTLFARMDDTTPAEAITGGKLYSAVVASGAPTLARPTREKILTRLGGVSRWDAMTIAPVGTKESVLLFGQSNAAGTVVQSQTADPLVPYMELNGTRAYTGPGPMDRRATGVHGCEFGWVAAAQAAGLYDPAFFKRCVGGTPLADKNGSPLSWSALIGAAGEHWDRLKAWLAGDASEEFAAIGWPTIPSVVIFGQGEQDAKVQADADAWGANMITLSDAMRVIWGGGLKIVVPRLHVDCIEPFTSNVRTSQTDVWEVDDPNNFLVTTVDAYTLTDGIHWDEVGQDAFGGEAYAIVHP